MDNTPFFHALAVFKCRFNSLYRIYVCPNELVFIWAGKGGEGLVGARAVSQSGGLESIIIGRALQWLLSPSKANEARREALDQTPLFHLIGDHPKNFRAAADEFEEVRIGPRSDGHARAYSDHGHQALLFLRHRTMGKYRLGISYLHDTQIAITELSRVFGEKCCIEIPWPEAEEKCGCGFCRLSR